MGARDMCQVFSKAQPCLRKTTQQEEGTVRALKWTLKAKKQEEGMA